jgi:GR25 family glycosyltransferase involved in LPS biosynthesis
MEHIDCVYYINLDHRIDRRQQFLEQMKAYDIPSTKLHLIPGIYTKGFGALGCAHSHIKALETFLASSFSTCIVFEDDFQFTLEKEYFNQILREIYTQKIDFDILLLAGNVLEEKKSEHPFLRRVVEAQTTAGYILTKSFAKILLKNFQEAAYLLHEYYTNHQTKVENFCIDRHWKALQPRYKWYVLFPKVGIQRESYSDIEERVTKYGV